MPSFWSRELERALTELLAEPYPHDAWVEAQGRQLCAVPVIWSLWAFAFLRPCGEVVVVDSEFGEPPRVHKDRGTVLQMLAWLARSHPELRALFPRRDAGSLDCQCGSQTAFASEGSICPICGGLGWLPHAEALP
jgi:hypothetical protein